MSIKNEGKRFNCTVAGCSRRFRGKQARDQHRRDIHGINARPMEGMSPDDVYGFVDALDLPDGAHWAMIEELSGYEPGDFA